MKPVSNRKPDQESAEVGDQPDLSVFGVVDHIDSDVDELGVQDVLAVAIIRRLLVVHRLLHGQYAGLGLAAVVGDVFANHAPVVAGCRNPGTKVSLTVQFVAERVGLGHGEIVGVRRVDKFAIELQGWQSMGVAFGIELVEYGVRPVGTGVVAGRSA